MFGINVFVAASANEFARLHELLSIYEASLRLDLRHAEFEHERTRLSEVYASPNAALVAEVEGEACGCVALVRLDASTCIVKRLYVRDAFRGRGVGRSLIEALIRKARDLHYARVVLDTHREELQAAYRLYLALGFTECEPFGTVDYACPTFMELTF